MSTTPAAPLSFPRLLPWLRLLGLASLSCLLLLADDFIQKLFTPVNQAQLELRYVAILWFFALGLWWSRSPRLVAAILLALACLQVLQLANLSYFGAPMSAIDLQSFFHDFDEVHSAAILGFAQHWHVLVAVGLPYAGLLWLHLWLPSRIALPSSRWGLLLIAVVLAAKPYRATYRNLDAFTPSPVRSSLHNTLNTTAAWSVRLALQPPVKLPPAPFAPYVLHAQPTQARHVWLVVADSWRGSRLHLLGYERNTTPRLRSYLESNPDSLVRPGIAAGVATSISLTYLLNPIREPGQVSLVHDQQLNLFRFAQDGGLRTHWLSSQESRLLSHLGSRYLDVSITRETHPLRFVLQQDRALLDVIDEQRWAPGNFVVINLRTAHLPYAANYRLERQALPWPDQNGEPQAQSNSYDNALLHLDDLLGEILARFDRLEGERYLVITGDHGQKLGEKGEWGHNDLVPEVSDVPVIIISRDAPAHALKPLAARRWLSHYQVSQWLAERLGTRIENPNQRDGEHYVRDKLLFGDNFIQRVCETPAGLHHEKPLQLSQWLAGATRQPACSAPEIEVARTQASD
ncbi:Phosphoethanolamine transferase EptC [compost metagenome]